MNSIKKFIVGAVLILGTMTNSVVAQGGDYVVFNTKTYKYHEMHCAHASRCTKSCIVVTRAQAIYNGGVHCKVCLKRY